jgi:hypothetical protein
MNFKKFGIKVLCFILGAIPKFAWGTEENQENLMIVDVPDGIGTEYFQDRS